MKSPTSTERILSGYRGPMSLAVAVMAMKAYKEHGAGNAMFEAHHSCLISALGSSLYICGAPGRFALRRVNALVNLLKSPAVLSSTPLDIQGYEQRTMCEMTCRKTTAPAPVCSNIVDSVKLIHEVFSIPVDRLLVEYLNRCSAGVSALYTYKREGMAVATAAADYIYAGNCVIGSVCVRERFRGDKLGAALAASVGANYNSAYLICEPELEKYYTDAGFEKTDVVYLNARRNDDYLGRA